MVHCKLHPGTTWLPLAAVLPTLLLSGCIVVTRPPVTEGSITSDQDASGDQNYVSSDVPPKGDEAYDAPDPDAHSATQLPSDASPRDAGNEPTPAAGPDERAPSFGEGAELSSPESAEDAGYDGQRAPSFGDGAELEATPDDERSARGLRRHSIRFYPAPPPGQPATPAPPPLNDVPPTPQPGGHTLTPVPPPPPAVRSDALTRTVYQMQTEVYGLEIALAGRPIGPRLILHIDALISLGQNLPPLSAGRPRLEALSAKVNLELLNLKAAAVRRDRANALASLALIEDLLGRMRVHGP